MLDGDSLTIVCAVDDLVEVDVGIVVCHGSHFLSFLLVFVLRVRRFV
jgi:hypothetical protein